MIDLEYLFRFDAELCLFKQLYQALAVDKFDRHNAVPRSLRFGI